MVAVHAVGDPGYLLLVSRLLPYKNVDVVIEAVALLPGERLVIVGEGPERRRLERLAGHSVQFLGTRSDAELAWLYANAKRLVAASHEDFGLTPLEAAGYGTPSVVLRWGGFLDTMNDDTATFFDELTAGDIAKSIREALVSSWDPVAITSHAARFDEAHFKRSLIRAVSAHAGRSRAR
mgnify:CR=1 FL=1